MRTTLYFAYGSNLNARQMKRRCPTATPVAKLELPNFRLVFRGVADIVPSAGDKVLGAVYRIGRLDELALDRYEGFNMAEPLMGMYRKEYFPVKIGGKILDVMYYTMNEGGIYPPSEGYFQSILEGYENWGLDAHELYRAANAAAKKWA